MRTTQLVLIPLAFVAGFVTSWAILYLGGLNPAFIPVLSASVGLIVAFGVPIWQVFYLNTPNLAIEISSIRRTISENASVRVADDAELTILVGKRTEDWGAPASPYGRRGRRRVVVEAESLESLSERLDFLKQRMRDLPAQVDEQSKELERVKSLRPETLTKYDVDTLNSPLYPEIDYDPSDHPAVLQALTRAYQKQLEGTEKEYAELQAKVPLAERKLEIVKQDLINNRSLFTVSVSLINSGRSNTAIKVPSLLRVLIGQGNYIDIKLSLKDFENKSEIPASGTRIAVFESPEISSLPEEDRSLINTYWGQSVRAWLLVEDIHGSIVRSNYIAFAEGLYQKIIYDRLARAAGGFSTEQ